MKYRIFILVISACLCTKCTSFKMNVPPSYQQQATALHVKGLSYVLKQQLHLGDYCTSKIHRSFLEGTTRELHSNDHFRVGLGEQLFNLQAVDEISDARHKYHYALFNKIDTAEVFCFESNSKETLAFRSKKSIFRHVSMNLYQHYNFSAAIVLNRADNEWEMEMGDDVLANRSSNLKNRLSKNHEEGFLAKGSDTIFIVPMKNLSVTTSKGKTIPFPAVASVAYELERNNQAIGMIDFMDENIYIMNDIPPSVKTLVASAATALLLRQVSIRN